MKLAQQREARYLSCALHQRTSSLQSFALKLKALQLTLKLSSPFPDPTPPSPSLFPVLSWSRAEQGKHKPAREKFDKSARASSSFQYLPGMQTAGPTLQHTWLQSDGLDVCPGCLQSDPVLTFWAKRHGIALEHLRSPAYSPGSLVALHGVFFLCQEHRAAAESKIISVSGTLWGFTGEGTSRPHKDAPPGAAALISHNLESSASLILVFGSYGW